MIGTALAVLLASAWGPALPVSASAAALVAVAYPVCEVTAAVVRRRRGHRPFSEGDRRHAYDRVVSKGWSPRQATMACVGIEAILVAGGLAMVAARLSLAAVVLALVAAAIGLLCGFAAVGALSPDAPVAPGKGGRL